MSDSSSSDGEDTWIQWFCGLPGHEMFCEVQRGYIEDGFNLYGLRHWVPRINDCLDVILDRVAQNEASHELMEATCALYGLIHARYVLTTAGLEAMYAKYTLQEFGNCPHYLCRGQSVVPLGVRDEPHIETVKLYCPKCQDVYVHPSHAAQRVDGAYIGTTFPHLFFMTYGTLVPDPPQNVFVPRVFGFRVHSSAASGASARGQGEQHHQRLQERRRVRQPQLHLPPPPSPQQPQEQQQAQQQAQQQQRPSAARESRAGGKAEPPAPAATVPAAAAAGTMPSDGAGKGSARVGGAEGEGESGVVVHIKEEEKSWTRGRGGDANGKEAGVRVVAETSDRKGFDGKPGAGGACLGSSGARNGHQTSAANGTANGTNAPVSPRRPAGGIGNGSCNASNASNGSVPPHGDRSDATSRAAEAAGHAKERQQTKPAGNEGVGGGENGVHEGSDAAVNGHVPAAAAAGSPGNGRAAGERGTKRYPEVELEATSPEILSGDVGAGERGAGGRARARGKAPRSRKHSSPVTRRVSSMESAAPAAMAEEGGGAGASNRRAAVETVARGDYRRKGEGQRFLETN